MNRTDAYSLVTERIIAKLQAGTIPWKHFASSPLAQPRNLLSKKVYRGINILLLSGTGFTSEYWLTYNQAVNLGGSVRKGEHGEHVVFWKIGEYEDKETLETKKSFLLKHYTVFNVEQCDGIDYAKIEEVAREETEANLTAEEIVAGMQNPPRIVIDGSPKACYSPSTDAVHMLERSKCVSDALYYDTFFHELTHSTQHPTRLDRQTEEQLTHQFGSKSYANEEL